MARAGSVAALVIGVALALLPTIPRPDPGTYPPLSMTYSVELQTGALLGQSTWATKRFRFDWVDADHWSIEVLESDDPRPGASQAGELLVVDGGTVQKRPCGDCATDTRNRTSEVVPGDVSPDLYKTLGSNPTLAWTDAPPALGIHRPSRSMQNTVGYPCAGLWAECAPGAPGQPPELADGIADAADSWRFIVFGDESGVPITRELSVGGSVVFRYAVEQISVPSS